MKSSHSGLTASRCLRAMSAMSTLATDPTFLFVHAGLWSFIWRDTIVRLQKDFRTIAIDFPGSGLAPAADTELTIPELGTVLAEFVAELDLSDVTLVAHDLGGPVALGAAADDPGRLSGGGVDQHLRLGT